MSGSITVRSRPLINYLTCLLRMVADSGLCGNHMFLWFLLRDRTGAKLDGFFHLWATWRIGLHHAISRQTSDNHSRKGEGVERTD